VIITPSRVLPRTTMVDFGRAIADAAAESGRRVAFVASCDWGHRHREDGPYGFHPASAEVDALVVQAVADGDPGRLIELEESKVADAAIDGLWQTLMLAGVMAEVPMDSEVLCYEAPRYYGMLVASFTPRANE
jgi:AmmeMemoRadiSam system protein B